MSGSSHKPNFEEMLRHRRVPWLMLALILAVYGLAITQVTRQMRARIRQQILNRDAEVLRAMVGAQFTEVSSDIQTDVRERVDQWEVLLKASRARGVVATRRFSTDGKCDEETFPVYVPVARLSEADRKMVLASQPIARFLPAVPRREIDLASDLESADQSPLKLVEVILPLQARPGAEIVGIGQFILEGESVAREFAVLDRSLLIQAVVIFAAGGAIIALSVGWAFVRLQLKHRQLADRTRDLLRANEELARAARTSAVGSVAAHLIHGLKNPLSGLHQFVQGHNGTSAGANDLLWRDAVASTRRMQQMVAEVVRVLREEEQGDAYELSFSELAGLIQQRIAAQLRETGVALEIQVSGDGNLDNRQANLLSLILGNLVQNAVQASSRNGVVSLELNGGHDGLECRVADHGPGLPETIRKELFAPCKSTREGGTGIGLAISKQLAGHLGADLRLENTSSSGTSFVLELPLRQRPVNSPLDEPVLRS